MALPSKHTISYDIYYNISRGLIPGITPIIRSGDNENLGTSLISVWGENNNYVYPDIAKTMTVSSSSINDVNITGSGAWIVKVFGLDSDYRWSYEIIALNGQNPVSTVNQYIRINFMQVLTAGTTGHNEGDIYIGDGTVTAGVPSIIYSRIMDGVIADHDNISNQSIFTVPKGYSLSIAGVVFSTGKGKGAKAGIFVKPCINNCVFQSIGKVYSFEGSQFIPFKYMPGIPEKTDIEIKAKADLSGGQVASSMTLLLNREDNNELFIRPGTYDLIQEWQF